MARQEAEAEPGDGAQGPPIPRHDFVDSAGRRTYVYGRLAGSLEGGRLASEPAALHKRFDELTATWIAISPARNVRPHSEHEAAPASGVRGSECPFCPGGPELPFDYDAAVVENRFPALMAQPPAVAPGDGTSGPATGRCEVVLYTARHEGSLAGLTPRELARVVAVWRDRTAELWQQPGHAFVLVFENSGDSVGATLSHPHGQIYAFDHLPPLIAARSEALTEARQRDGGCLTCRVVDRDEASSRVVAANGSFVVCVPFAARWPYEVHVRARRHGLGRLGEMTGVEQRDLAAALRQVTARYGRLFDFPLPYMMAALEAPENAPDWHLAFEFYPPHRNHHQTKVRASVETATGLFINDTLPEETARALASLAVPEVREAAPVAVARQPDPR